MAATRPARACATARRSSALASRRTSTGRVRLRVRTTATPTWSRTTRSHNSATSSAGRTKADQARAARLGPDAGTRGRAACALPAVARGGLRRGRGGRRAARGADRVVARLALAGAAARRGLDLAAGIPARVAAQCRRMGGLDARRRPGRARAALRAQRPADRALERHRGARGRPAPARRGRRLARRPHARGAPDGRPHVLRRRDRLDRRGTSTGLAHLRVSHVQAGLIEAVVFDLDGVIVDSEQVWDDVRVRYTRESGGTYTDSAARDMMGMSSVEWSRYMAEQLAVPGTPEEINAAIVERMLARYGEEPPLIPGAADAVRRCAERLPLAVASSSTPELIEVVLRAAGLRELFRAVVSSQEVARGKPAPDVYLEAASRLGVAPAACAAVEDSHNGIRSAKAAGMRVIALPNPHFPPDDEALASADVVLHTIDELTLSVIDF